MWARQRRDHAKLDRRADAVIDGHHPRSASMCQGARSAKLGACRPAPPPLKSRNSQAPAVDPPTPMMSTGNAASSATMRTATGWIAGPRARLRRRRAPAARSPVRPAEQRVDARRLVPASATQRRPRRCARVGAELGPARTPGDRADRGDHLGRALRVMGEHRPTHVGASRRAGGDAPGPAALGMQVRAGEVDLDGNDLLGTRRDLRGGSCVLLDRTAPDAHHHRRAGRSKLGRTSRRRHLALSPTALSIPSAVGRSHSRCHRCERRYDFATTASRRMRSPPTDSRSRTPRSQQPSSLRSSRTDPI